MGFVLPLLSAVGLLLAGEPPAGMVLIPAGEAIVGSTREQIESAGAKYGGIFVYESEYPQRKVYVKAFYIDIYEVSNAEYKKFVDATGHKPPLNWVNVTYPQGRANHPVTYVTWTDAMAYAQWAGKRLPTETEWEKAARGTDGRLYPWGNEFDPARCNIRIWGQALDDTVPVDSFPNGVSPYGVYNMAGNAFEWTATVDEKTLKLGFPNRVLKGGSFKSFDMYARCAFRQPFHPDCPGPHIGFRCAKDAE